jgi:hypothetical protein
LDEINIFWFHIGMNDVVSMQELKAQSRTANDGQKFSPVTIASTPYAMSTSLQTSKIIL